MTNNALDKTTRRTFPYNISQDSLITDNVFNFSTLPNGALLGESGLNQEYNKDTIQGSDWYNNWVLYPEGKPSFKALDREGKEYNIGTRTLTYTDMLSQRQQKMLKDKDYNPIKNYSSIPGTIVKAIIEFPEISIAKPGGEEGSEVPGSTVFIELDDAISLSYSVYRAKSPVITLGQNSVGGYALGPKTVAGSLIRAVFLEDNFTEFQSRLYVGSKAELQQRLLNINSKIPTGRPKKEEWAIMKDDLTVFNIHLAIIAEDTDEWMAELFETPQMRFESILGCVAINNGQVFSIQDLLTETTMSFQAKTVKTATDPADLSLDFSTNTTYKSVSDILNK